MWCFPLRTDRKGKSTFSSVRKETAISSEWLKTLSFVWVQGQPLRYLWTAKDAVRDLGITECYTPKINIEGVLFEMWLGTLCHQAEELCAYRHLWLPLPKICILLLIGNKPAPLYHKSFSVKAAHTWSYSLWKELRGNICNMWPC